MKIRQSTMQISKLLKVKDSIARKEIERQQQMLSLKQSFNNDKSSDLEARNEIVKLESTKLREKLLSGELSSVTVLKAFQYKALEVTKKTNCITEFIPEAQEWAEACDRIPVAERGLLHGIPVSLKENIDVAGMDSTVGLAKFLHKPVADHAVLVDVLLKNGAIPFCKTNVPQTLMTCCCSNPVYGITTNPYDSSRTSGGSSGGEGALIGGGGSILGIGTDLGGSVRQPASLCGCVAIKPTYNRLSSEGFLKPLHGVIGVYSCPGIMGRDVAIVELCMQALTNDALMRDRDVSIIPLKWKETVDSDKQSLTFGYYDDILDFFPTTPGVKRAVNVAKLALEKAGHTLVPFQLLGDNFETCKDIYSCLDADEGKTVKKLCEDEIIDQSVESIITNINLPLSEVSEIKKNLEKKSRVMAVTIQDAYFSSFKLWENQIKREKYVKDLAAAMKSQNIDLLLSPVFPFPAPHIYEYAKVAASCYYTMVFNYCDFPSGTVPVTKETDEDQKLLEEEYPDDPLHCQIVKEETRGATGLPIGVLVTGLRFQDELVCRGMAELEKALINQHQ